MQPAEPAALTDEQIDKIAASKLPIAAYMGLYENAKFSRDDAERVIRQFARAIERAIRSKV